MSRTAGPGTQPARLPAFVPAVQATCSRAGGARRPGASVLSVVRGRPERLLPWLRGYSFYTSCLAPATECRLQLFRLDSGVCTFLISAACNHGVHICRHAAVQSIPLSFHAIVSSCSQNGDTAEIGPSALAVQPIASKWPYSVSMMRCACRLAAHSLLDVQQHCVQCRLAACGCTCAVLTLSRYLSRRALQEEGVTLLGAIQRSTTGAPWEVLLDMVGTENFGATYP